jgi:hypothetical protein
MISQEAGASASASPDPAGMGSHGPSLFECLRVQPHVVSQMADCSGLLSMVEPLRFFTPLEDQLGRQHFRHSIQSGRTAGRASGAAPLGSARANDLTPVHEDASA